jgi:hypothetical protein
MPQAPGGNLFEAYLRQQLAKLGIRVQPGGRRKMPREVHAPRVMYPQGFTGVANQLAFLRGTGSGSSKHRGRYILASRPGIYVADVQSKPEFAT